MISNRGLTRRLAPGAAIIAAGALALAMAGTAQAAVPHRAVPQRAVAHRAVPNRWGFAYVNRPSVPGIPDVTRQAGSWPPGFVVHVQPGLVGQVLVRFPRIGGRGGVVLVTAVSPAPVWCQAQKWARSGPNEIVAVRCYRAGGVPVFTPFTVAYSQSSAGPVPAGRRYGYVRYSPAHGVVARFNSAGLVNTVAPAGPGAWKVRLPGLGSAGRAGNVQVTAVNAAAAAKCEVSGWTSVPGRQLITVRCYNKTAVPLKTGWSLVYQRGRAVTGTQPKHFAYTFDNKPFAAGPYAPAPAAVNFNSAAATNTIRRAGGGLRLVTLPKAAGLPSTVLVTAVGSGGRFCSLLSPWASSPAGVIVRDVACYTAAGAATNTASLITYTSAH
jgi:hypothetical protein